MFLTNYTDALSDVPLPAVIDSFKNSGNIACFVSVKPRGELSSNRSRKRTDA